MPHVDEKKCINCGICLLLCHSYRIDFEQLENFDKDDIIFGRYRTLYTAYSLDSKIRLNSTSGGVITQLAVELVNRGEIDKVTVLPFDNYAGQAIAVKLSNDIREIKDSAKSKYCPVSVENVIKNLQERPQEKLLIVGTPCQLYGIKEFIKIMKFNPENYIFFGLMCDSTMNFNFLRYIRDKYRLNGEEISLLEYRTKEKYGWPGGVKIVFNSGRTVTLPNTERINVKPFFKLNKCNYCFDKLNIQSDITFGDCYIKGDESEEGKSSIIVRTEKGEEILRRYAKKLFLKKESKERVVESQCLQECYKKLFLGAKYFDIYDADVFDLVNDGRISLGKHRVFLNAMFSFIGTRYRNISLFTIERNILGLVKKIARRVVLFFVSIISKG